MTKLNYDKVSQAVEAFAKTQEEFRAKMTEEFKGLFKEFFEEYPEIVAVGWNQYTPYFNDGDTCEFSVGDMFAVAAESVYTGEEDEDEDSGKISLDDVYSAYELEELDFPYSKPGDYEYEHYKLNGEKSYYASSIRNYERAKAENGERFDEVASAWSSFHSAIKKIPDDVFENAFDDHVFVLATKDGFEVKEYSHD